MVVPTLFRLREGPLFTEFRSSFQYFIRTYSNRFQLSEINPKFLTCQGINSLKQARQETKQILPSYIAQTSNVTVEASGV